MKEIWRNLKIWQRVLAIIGPLAIIVIIVVAVVTNVLSEPKVKIEFPDGYNIPVDELRGVREYLSGVIESNTEDFDKNMVYVGKARDYKEETDGGSTTATFIVDFDDIRQSYSVAVTWPDPDDGSPNIYISCPLLDSKYPETPCVTEANSSTEIVGYLPYKGKLNDREYSVDMKYDEDKTYLEIEVDACKDKTILNDALVAVKEWISSVNLNQDDYLYYVLPDICNGQAILYDFETDYVQANHAKTNDENVNKVLPYYIPEIFYVYPLVDENNNVVSIKAKVPGCYEYQVEPGKEIVQKYLETYGINYPVEFEYCVE